MTAAAFVLVPVCAAALIIACLCVARLARAWKSTDGTRVVDDDRAQIALQDEKERLLLTLKDLDHEYSLGKLSKADHEAMKARFEAEALAVINQLRGQKS